MNELNIWGDEKPDVGRCVNLYARYSECGLWARVFERDERDLLACGRAKGHE